MFKMSMFHLQFPESNAFLTWDEMGCLCRSLGLPVDLFQRNFPTDELELVFNESGIAVKTIQRLFELNLLQKALHRTYNMHTADWNVCVIIRAIYMLEHRVLDFEGLHDVRVAYGTYEHVDMKGLVIQKHVLLRTLKMCGRNIAPMKLMHRIKHMKGEFEEKGRIQLYEFFNLIVWCDLYTEYDPGDVEKSSGKENNLFNLVDFERLLSHHDERVANKLNSKYLAEEWDFGMEALGSKEMFKEPPVYTEARITQAFNESMMSTRILKNIEKARNDKQNYRSLKREVTSSQKRLYRAHAGSIRSRPISAPDLDNYRRREVEKRPVETSAQEAYETMKKRLHSAPSRASTQTSVPRPSVRVSSYAPTPQVVTPRDLVEVERKMENLQFDITTLGSRRQLQIENEMGFYIPGYLEKLANKKPEEPPTPEPARKERHWTSKIINNLAYPSSNLKPKHAKNCDARYRGWQRANSKPGYHAIITSHTHEKSERGRMFARMERTMLEPVQYTHQDYVIRYTPKTWPGSSTSPTRSSNLKPGSKSEASQSDKGSEALKRKPPYLKFRSLEKSDEAGDKDEDNTADKAVEIKRKVPKDLTSLHNKYLSEDESLMLGLGLQLTKEAPIKAKPDGRGEKNGPRSQLQPQAPYPRGLDTLHSKSSHGVSKDSSKIVQPLKQEDDMIETNNIANDLVEESPLDEDVHMPHMEHSGPKLVGVGQIGTISLLENIQESRHLEEKLEESPRREDLIADIAQDEDLSDSESLTEAKDLKIEIIEKKRKTRSRSGSRGQMKGQSRPSRSQPSSDQKSRTLAKAEAINKRPTRSAPQRRRAGGSPKQTPSKVCTSSEGEVEPKDEDVGVINTPAKACNGAATESKDNEIPRQRLPSSKPSSAVSHDTSTSSDMPKGFKAMHGSVTSEEGEKAETSSPNDVAGVSKRKKKNKILTPSKSEPPQNQENNVEDDDQSSYSDALTLASSDGLSDLPLSPPVGSARLPFDVRLGNSCDIPDTPPVLSAEAIIDAVLNAPRIHFSLMGEDGTGRILDSLASATTQEGAGGLIGRHSSAAVDIGKGLMVQGDWKGYLSDSGPPRPYSRESRTRLVNRMEGAISPDLRHRLMEGDSAPTIQAS